MLYQKTRCPLRSSQTMLIVHGNWSRYVWWSHRVRTPIRALTPSLSTPLSPDNCRQIHMRLSPGKPTRKAVATMGSNDLVIGEDHIFGPSCQRYNWQTGRCGSMAFGSSPRSGKAQISNPGCLAEVSTCGKDFRR